MEISTASTCVSSKYLAVSIQGEQYCPGQYAGKIKKEESLQYLDNKGQRTYTSRLFLASFMYTKSKDVSSIHAILLLSSKIFRWLCFVSWLKWHIWSVNDDKLLLTLRTPLKYVALQYGPKTDSPSRCCKDVAPCGPNHPWMCSECSDLKCVLRALRPVPRAIYFLFDHAHFNAGSEQEPLLHSLETQKEQLMSVVTLHNRKLGFMQNASWCPKHKKDIL